MIRNLCYLFRHPDALRQAWARLRRRPHGPSLAASFSFYSFSYARVKGRSWGRCLERETRGRRQRGPSETRAADAAAAPPLHRIMTVIPAPMEAVDARLYSRSEGGKRSWGSTRSAHHRHRRQPSLRACVPTSVLCSESQIKSIALRGSCSLHANPNSHLTEVTFACDCLSLPPLELRRRSRTTDTSGERERATSEEQTTQAGKSDNYNVPDVVA